MSTARLFLFALASVLSLGLLGACDQSGSSDVAQTDEGVLRLGAVEAVDTLTRTVAPNERPLILNGFRGTIQLRGEEGEAARLTFLQRGRGEDAEAARSVLDGISITESGTESSYTYTMDAEGETYAAVDVQGTVPRASSLRVERMSGPVDLVGVEGEITITHEYGSVDVREAVGPVEVDIENGDVRVDFRRMPASGNVSLRTSNGNIHLGLPTDASIELDARTNVGSIRTGGLTLMAERFTPLNAGARYSAQMGEGETSVELRTENGSLFIQEADTTRPPAPSQDTMVVPPADTVVPTLPSEPGGPSDTTDTVSTDQSSSDTTGFQDR